MSARAGTVLLPFLAAFLCLTASAEIPYYYPYRPPGINENSVYQIAVPVLGAGFRPENLKQGVPASCVTGGKLPDEPGWDLIQATTRSASDITSLVDAQNISVEAYAQTPEWSMKASYLSQRRITSNSRNVTVVVKASQVTKPQVWGGTIGLTTEAQAHLGNEAAFKQRCGTHFIRAIHRGISFAATITIVDASDTLHQQVNASVTGTYGSGDFSAGATAAFNSEIKTARDSRRYEVSVEARGGGGVESMRQFLVGQIREKPDLDAIGKAIEEAFTKLTEDKAVIIGFEVVDYPGVDFRAPWSIQKGKEMARLTERFITLSDREFVARQIGLRKDQRYRTISDPVANRWLADADIIDAAAKRVLAVHTACNATQPPGSLAPCEFSVPDNQQVKAAMEIEVPPTIYRPRMKFGIAARIGEDWRLLDGADANVIFRSRAADNQPEPIRMETGSDYVERFTKRAASSIPDATHIALVAMIDSENLESLAVVGHHGYTVNTVTGKKIGGTSKTIVSFPAADIRAGKYAPKRFTVMDPKLPYQHAIVLLVTPIATTTVDPKLLPDWKMFDNWITELRPTLFAATVGGALEIRLEARDKFFGDSGGEPEQIALLTGDFAVSDRLPIRRVNYTVQTLEPRDSVLLGSPPGQLPMSVYPDSRTFRVDNHTRYSLPGLTDSVMGRANYCEPAMTRAPCSKSLPLMRGNPAECSIVYSGGLLPDGSWDMNFKRTTAPDHCVVCDWKVSSTAVRWYPVRSTSGGLLNESYFCKPGGPGSASWKAPAPQ